MTKFINLTPHQINVIKNDGLTHVIEPSGTIARVSATISFVDTIDGIDIFRQEFGEVIDLPAPKEDTFLIVSRMVKDRVPGRFDVLVPGSPIRDEWCRIIGHKGLSL